MRKFLLVSPDFPPPLIGGSLVYLYTMILNSNLSFDILTSKKDLTKKEIEMKNGDYIYRSNYIYNSHQPRKINLISTYLYMLFWVFKKNIFTKYDAILVNPGTIGNSLLILLGKIMGINVIVIGHAEEITIPLKAKGLKNFIKRILMKYSYKKARGHIVVCDFCKNLFLSMDVNPKKIFVVPSFPNPEKISSFKNTINKKNQIVSVGRLIERKGFHFLIEAVVELRKNRIPDLNLEIIGKGPFFNKLKKQIETNKAQSFINLRGKISDLELSNTYNESKIFVLANHMLENGDTEGCPSVFSEAMAHELPIIGGTGGGVDTVISNNKNGYIVASKNISQISEKIFDLINNDTLRNEMINFGKYKLKQEHNHLLASKKFDFSITNILNI